MTVSARMKQFLRSAIRRSAESDRQRSNKPPSANFSTRRWFAVSWVVAGIVCSLLAGYAGFTRQADLQIATADQGLTDFKTALSALLARHESLPKIMALDPRLLNLLHRPGDKRSIADANAYLSSVNDRGGLLAAYVIDRDGLTLASSNWAGDRTFVGQNYRFRPYFQEAIKGGIGRFYAVGQTSLEPGYFIAYPIVQGDEILGIAVVKIDLQPILGTGSAQTQSIAVADETGVIFLASNPALRYKSIIPLAEGDHAKLTAEKRYGAAILSPLKTHRTAFDRPVVEVGGLLLERVSQSMGFIGWHVNAFVDISSAYGSAVEAAFIGGFAVLAVGATFCALDMRRRRGIDLILSRDALFNSQQRLRTVADNLPFMVGFIDRDERYVFVNAAHALYTRPETECREGLTVKQILPADEYDTFAPQMAIAWQGRTVTFDWAKVTRSGAVIIESTLRPEWNSTRNRVTGLHMVGQDVTSIRRRLQELSKLARLDHLTQLLNRNGFEVSLRDGLKVDQNGHGLGLVFIDLDDFKLVNDHHGHAAGDAVLKSFSKRLSTLVRASDALARLGGDEFAIVMPGITSAAAVEQLANNIIRVASTPFEVDIVGGSMVTVGASVGIALVRQGADAELLCKRADEALYEAKRVGKGQYRIVGHIGLFDSSAPSAQPGDHPTTERVNRHLEKINPGAGCEALF